MGKLNRKSSSTKRMKKPSNKLTSYQWGGIKNLGTQMQDQGIDVGAGIGGIGASIAGVMNADTPAQKAMAVGSGISSVGSMIPIPGVSQVIQGAGAGVEAISGIVNAQQMKEKERQQAIAAAKANHTAESMKTLANYDTKGTGLTIAVAKGGAIPFPYQEQLKGGWAVAPTMMADGGKIRSISDTSSQVVGDNPNMTDGVVMGDFALDHNETTVETPTGLNIYSDDLKIPGTKTSFADANKKLQRIKKMLPKTQARVLGHVVPKGRNILSDLPDPKFRDYNSKIDEEANRLFEMQESMKQFSLGEPMGYAKGGEIHAGNVGNYPGYLGVGRPTALAGAGQSSGLMTRAELDAFRNDTSQIPALRNTLSDAGWGNALRAFDNPNVNAIEMRDAGAGSQVAQQFMINPAPAPNRQGVSVPAGMALPDTLQPVNMQRSNKVNAYNYNIPRSKDFRQGLQRMVGYSKGGTRGYLRGGTKEFQKRMSQIGNATNRKDREFMVQAVYDSLMQSDPAFQQYRQNAPARRSDELPLAYNLRALEGYNTFNQNAGMIPDQQSYEPSMEYDPQLGRYRDRSAPVELSGFTLPMGSIGRPGNLPNSLASVPVPQSANPSMQQTAETVAPSPIGQAISEGNLWGYMKDKFAQAPVTSQMDTVSNAPASRQSILAPTGIGNIPGDNFGHVTQGGIGQGDFTGRTPIRYYSGPYKDTGAGTTNAGGNSAPPSVEYGRPVPPALNSILPEGLSGTPLPKTLSGVDIPESIPGVNAPEEGGSMFRDPSLVAQYGPSLLKMFQQPPNTPRAQMENMVRLQQVRPDAQLANIAAQRATAMKQAQRASANPNVAFGQQNRIFGASINAQNQVMGDVQRTNAAIQSRQAMINAGIGARNTASLNRMGQQQAERKMAQQRNIVDSANEMRNIYLNQLRDQNMRELDKWRWRIASSAFGDSGVPARQAALRELTATSNRRSGSRYD